MEPQLTPTFRRETEAAIEAVQGAFEIIRARTGADDVRYKAPGDIVTGTDIAAQEAMHDLLRARWPSVGFVGEEGQASVPLSERYWLVDPLCGTTNFAAGLPLVGINVALVEDSQVTIGAVCDGTTGEVYVAERGHGAWRVGGGPLRASDASGIVSVDPVLAPSKAGRGLATELTLRVIASQRWITRSLGTTLVLAHVAAGRIAAAVYVGGASPVHLAAGLLVAEEAGAIVTDAEGRPWHQDAPAFIVAATRGLHTELLAVLSSRP